MDLSLKDSFVSETRYLIYYTIITILESITYGSFFLLTRIKIVGNEINNVIDLIARKIEKNKYIKIV